MDSTQQLQPASEYSALDLVGAYIRTASPIAGVMIANRDTYATRLASSELIYNLSDVEKFLPKLNDDIKREEWGVETVTRKRKERQDSGSSSVQERKVIRSNSEERTPDGINHSDDNIRRVSSHEDFERNKKLVNRAIAAPLHEQNYDDSCSPLKSALIDADYESFYNKDDNISSNIGEKYSHIFGQNIDNEHSSTDFFCIRQKYSKNDSSPSRSRIHEYILFPKRISPNRDPNADTSGAINGRDGWSSIVADERDHERARCNERRSRTPAFRTRRGPPRRQTKQRSSDLDASKENDVKQIIDKGQSFVHKDVILPNCSKKSETVILGGEKCHKNDVTTHGLSKKEDTIMTNFSLKDQDVLQTTSSEQNALQDKRDSLDICDRAQSPVIQSISPIKKTPVIDLSMLHEQLGQNEPVPSVPIKFMGFPWDSEACQTFHSTVDSEPLRDENIGGYDNIDISNIRSQRRTLPDKCDGGNVEKTGSYKAVIEPEERLNKISKKLQGLKKKIAKCEADFEMTHGYRASQADKMNNEVLCKLYSDMRRLKNEKKSIKSGPGESLSRPVPTENVSGESLRNKPMIEIMADIERRLELKRISHQRPQKLEECSYLQLSEEKAALQRALLWLEGARGRPTEKADRDSARPLYDRYRAVKRLVARYDAAKANSSIGELETIMEHETMLFTNLDSPIDSPEAADKPSQSDSGTSNYDLSERKDIEDPTSSSAKSTASEDTNIVVDEQGMISNENLHCLPLKELSILLVETKNLRALLKRNIKLAEAEFEEKNSRKVLKDERLTVLPSYIKYKETKARLRLLNALVNKQKKAYG